MRYAFQYPPGSVRRLAAMVKENWRNRHFGPYPGPHKLFVPTRW